MLIKTTYILRIVVLSILLVSCASIKAFAPNSSPTNVDENNITEFARPPVTSTKIIQQSCKGNPQKSLPLKNWLIVSKIYTVGEYKIIDPVSFYAADVFKGLNVQISPDNSGLVYPKLENGTWSIYYADIDNENLVKQLDNLAYTRWVNKDTIVLNMDFQLNRYLMLLNISSGTIKDINTNFPDFHPYAQELLNIWKDIPSVNSSLEYAVYPTLDGINMIKLSSKEIVFRTKTSPYTSTPIWSPTGDSFITALSPHRNELIRVYLDGRTERVSSLENTNMYISSYAWSPDGKKITFWLVDNSSSKPIKHLAVSDLINRNTTITCMDSFGQSSAFYDTPVWSPEGRFIAVSIISATTEVREVHIFDTITGGYFEIQNIDDYIPLGWLTFAPKNK
jgi:hypothetical protein